MDWLELAAIAITLLSALVVLTSPFWAPKVAHFLRAIGLDDEVREAIRLAEDYWPVIEAAAKETEWKGDDKLSALAKTVATSLGKSIDKLPRKVSAAIESTAARLSAEDKLRKGGSIQLDDAGMGPRI